MSRGRSSLIRTSFCILSLITILFMASLLIPPASAGASDMDWSLSPVTLDNYAIEISMANDSQGYAHIAYIDNVDRDLFYARETSSGWVIRNIGPTDWYNEVDGRARTAIDVDSDGVARIVYSGDNDAIWYVANAASGAPQATGKSGVSLSMDISSYDEAHISYVRSNGIYWAVLNWMGMWMEYSANDGMFAVSNICTSVAVDDSGLPYVAFVDSSGWLRCSYPDGEAWNVMQVDDLYNDIDHLSIGINQLGQPVIAYASLSVYYDLLFAEYDGVAWSIYNVDAASSVYDPLHMDVDDNGVAHVAYIDMHTHTLMYATNGNGWSTAPVTDPLGAYRCGGIRAVSNGSVKIAFTNDGESLYLAVSEAADPAPSITSTPVTTGQETVEYEYPLTADQTVTWSLSTDASFLDLASGTVTGTPGTDDAGTYYVNITATNGTTSLSSYQNFTLTIGDSWAPAPDAVPLDGQETAYYEYHPVFNESVMVVYMDTNAPFLELVDEDVKFSFEDKYYAGTPEVGDAGTYWINVTAFSLNGRLPYFMNETFVIDEAYANHITNSPGDGRESLYYRYTPTFDGAMTLIDWHSDADWMLLYGPLDKGPGFPNYWYGTPEAGDAGTYYLNITLQSIGGLLYTTHNFTFSIGESWAPSLESSPSDGRVTVPYSYSPMYNESDAIVAASTDAPFLIWNETSGAFEGIPGLGDAGTYWFNMTAESVDGIMTLVSNLSFEILPMPTSLRINSDADMLAAVSEYQWAGDGSEDDPFIVTGLIIDSLGIDENALFIGNVTYSFVVTGNDLGNAGPTGSWTDARSASLYIYNCDGPSITENRLWGSLFGLCLMGCSEISVDDNLVELNDYAGIVVLSDCQYISIENSTVDGNGGTYGIWIKGAAYVRMANNTLSNANNAVAVEDDDTTSSSYIIFRDNDVGDVWNGLVLSNVLDAMVVNNTFSNVDPSLSEAAIGVYYGLGMEISGNTIADCRNGVYLYDSAFILLESNVIAVSSIGVYMEASTFVHLANGSISADTGVLADESYQCEIRGLDISDGLIGVNVYEGCEEVLVADCSLDQLFIGVKVYSALDTTVLNCTFTTISGVEDDSSQGTNVSECTFNGSLTAIYAYGSSGLEVMDNALTNCSNGILMEDTLDSMISGNTLSGIQADISLINCGSIVIDGNVIFGKRTEDSGISLSECQYITLRQNAIEDGAVLFDIDAGSEAVSGHDIDTSNTVGGKPVYYYDSGDYSWSTVPADGGQIIIVSATNLMVNGLETTSCTAPVYIISSLHIRLYHLDLYGAGVGVTMLDSGDIWIVDGVMENMSIGILGLYVDALLISGMMMSDNYDAIYVATSEFGPASNVVVENCRIEGSRHIGVTFEAVDFSSISSSVIANSVSYGVKITGSMNVMVVENLFYRNNGAGDGYSVPTQAYADSDTNYFDNNGRGNYWSEQLGPDADGDGIVDDFTYVVDGEASADSYPLAFVFTTEPVTEGRNGMAYEYLPETDQLAYFSLETNTWFLLINPSTGKITGTPEACGSFYLHIRATLMEYMDIWQNFTLSVTDTWAPEISGTPATGKETVEYSFQPLVNESDAIIAADTDAPFLSWNGTAFAGTPGLDDAGIYWINITATSVDGLLTSHLNQTFSVADTWAAQFQSAPGAGQETVYYEHLLRFNESVEIVSYGTNAPFLLWSDDVLREPALYPFFNGTPGMNHAGVYWMNITVRSVDGLLESYQNSTFVIGESWAPASENVPQDGQETVGYEHMPEFNETVSITGQATNALFLSWNGTAFVGTPTIADAGTYWINITAVSVEGLLSSYQNSTFVIGDSWAPEISGEAMGGQETVGYEYVPQFNETVTISGPETNAPFLIWNGSAFVGTPTVADAGTYWMNITAVSVEGLLSASLNVTFVIGEAWAPDMAGDPVMDGKETLDYVYAPEVNETVEWAFDTDAPFLSWNGTAVIGLPGLEAAGIYWVNITAVSSAGLLSSWQNYTLVIDDTWSSEFLSEPVIEGLFATLEFQYNVETNESAELQLSTDAQFLSLNGRTVSGTMVAGVYYVNITAISSAGLLASWQNFTLTVAADDADPIVEITSPADGAKLNDSEVSLEWAASDADSGLGGVWLKVDDGEWTLLNGTQRSLELSEGEHTLSVKARDAVGNEATDSVTVSVDITAPTVLMAAPQGSDVSLDAPFSIIFSEAMDVDTVTVTVNGAAVVLTWNGSTAAMAGDWEHSTEYAVVVNGADLHGNDMLEHSWTFSTEDLLVLVSGTLVDADGAPIANAIITVNGTVLAVTDADGSYSFLLPPGNHTVAVSADGYQNATVELTLEEQQTSLDLEMVKADKAPRPWVFYAIILLVICMVAYVIYREQKS